MVNETSIAALTEIQQPSAATASATATSVSLPQPSATREWTLRGLFRAYRWRMLLTYALFNLENALRLVQPLVLGVAINGLLRSSFTGLILFVVQHLAHLLIGTMRRAYDTRVFTGIYTDLATDLVLRQRGQEIETSRITARSSLSRAFVDFFERDVPIVLRSSYSVFGALLMLLFYDWTLIPLCLALLAPVCFFNSIYSRKTFLLSGKLHDELENEVDVIGERGAAEVRDHYRRAGSWRIKLSDWEALNFSLTELFVLGLMAAALVRACSLGLEAGDIFAVFRYVLMFIIGMDSVPRIVQQVSRLRDIGNRLQEDSRNGFRNTNANRL